MKTNAFRSSAVFRFEDKSINVSHYPNEPIKSSDEVEISMHPVAKVNYFLAINCHFLVYEKHNENIIFDGNEKHIVKDENQDYRLVAFLDKKGDVLSNSVDLITRLPKGLEMKKQFAISEINVFSFSGLNVMLFEEKPKFN